MKAATTRPSSGPASSWRKWPAPARVGWSRPRAPGTCGARIGAIAAGDRVGVAEGDEERLLPLRPGPPRPPGWPRWPGRRGGSGPASAWPGRRPCSPRSGTARRTPRARRRSSRGRSPSATSRPMSSTRAFSTALRNSHQISGMSKSPVGEPGVGRDDAGEPVGVLGDQPQPDQPAPVLADQGHLAQVEVVEGQLAGPLDVPGVGVVARRQRLVRPAEPDRGPAPRTGSRRRPAPRSRAGRGRTTTARRAAAAPPVRRRARRRRTPSAACRRPGRRPRRTTAATGSRAARRSGRRACDRSPRSQSDGPTMTVHGQAAHLPRFLRQADAAAQVADRRPRHRGGRRAVDDRLQPRGQHPGPAGRADPRGRLRGVRLRPGRLDLGHAERPRRAGPRDGRTARQRGLRGGAVRRRARHAAHVHPARERRQAADRPARA